MRPITRPVTLIYSDTGEAIGNDFRVLDGDDIRDRAKLTADQQIREAMTHTATKVDEFTKTTHAQSKAMAMLIRGKKVSANDVAVYSMCCACLGYGGKIKLTQSAIAADLGMTQQAVSRSFIKWVKLGYIAKGVKPRTGYAPYFVKQEKTSKGHIGLSTPKKVKASWHTSNGNILGVVNGGKA